VLADPDYTLKEAQRLGGFPTPLGVPLKRDGQLIGIIAINRITVRPFDEKHIRLIETFAEQAVIAIENARLFDELQTRTKELARTVGELEALGEVGRTISSTLDLQAVLFAILKHAFDLAGSGSGAIYTFDQSRGVFDLEAGYNMSEELIAAVRATPIPFGVTLVGECAERREPVQIEDLTQAPPHPLYELSLKAGVRALLALPLLHRGEVVGALVVRRRTTGAFDSATIELLQAFAAQSAVAVQNAGLFQAMDEKSHQLEEASRHKSQFLANLSHELRTPLNSVLGFTEMLSDGLYGELPEKAKQTLGRITANGRHLLGLINDVLDLSKIEAGQFSLALEDYSLGQIVKTVAAATEPLARAKGLTLAASVADGLPFGRGDERRLSQVLLNLVGNAVKFTDRGHVNINAIARDGRFKVEVRDTGPGIAPEHQARIFEEFQQIDTTSTRQKGGTGFGLAISKRIIEMHGGKIELDSVVGSGSTFRVTIPIRVDPVETAA
jgi:signal transduction histidine kinase